MNTARQIAVRMLDEVPDDMLSDVINYIAFINSKKNSKLFEELEDASLSSIDFWNNHVDDEVWNNV